MPMSLEMLPFLPMDSRDIPPLQTIFTVYQTPSTIELHQGNHDVSARRVICSFSSYDLAKRLGKVAADVHGLLFIDYAHRDDIPNSLN